MEATELNHSPDATSTSPPKKILRSSFVSDSSVSLHSPRALSVVEVRFKKTTCVIASDDTGTPTLLEGSSEITGFLETKVLELGASERGNTKDVFIVSRMIFA